MSLTDLLNIWRNTPAIVNNVTAWRTFSAQAEKCVPLPHNLHPDLAQSLQAGGIKSLYTHQATAWKHVQAGQHPVIVTGTASGKTLCYNLPVFQRLFTHSDIRALYLFPTKALAHDQLTVTNKLLAGQALAAATYDGDTPANMRSAIRANAQIVLSNPDMLHTAVLPHHTKWAKFFSNLRFVVLDEMHVYRGVFGSHVANVIRRLKRIAQFYGASPQFILTSATIANPVALAERLIEAPVKLVNNDGAARGAKHFLIYNPPVIDKNLGVRRSTLQESTRLTQELLGRNVQTIVFARTRRTVEILLTHLQKTAATAQATSITNSASTNPSPRTSASTIRAYRSGYLPRQRREIERGLRTGNVQAVVATSALELGIDIGSMGAAVLAGYPGTIAGTWQQAGRAGRQDETSLAMLITSANPLDQFLAHHPAYFFDRSPEEALINPDNLLILLQHLRCAAFELPFQVGEPFGSVESTQVGEFLRFLQESGDLHRSGGKFFWMADRYPAEQVSLRSASPAKVRLLVENNDNWLTIGEVDLASAPWMVHPQAIYLHQGDSYVVETLDLTEQVARMRPVQVDYYTESIQKTDVTLIELLTQAAAPGGNKNHGEILVTRQVTGYNIVHWYTHARLGAGEVDLPPDNLHTTGYWLTIAPETVQQLVERGLWRNAPNNYGPNWSTQRNKVRTRDNYCCRMCGAPEQGRRHDVHHKIPFRTFDSYRQANQLSNLITLCKSCHRRAETVVRMRSGLSGLATALGHLAPLFLMCDTHDVGIHPDPECPLAKGQPAIVIYDRVPAGIGFSERLFELHNQLIAHACQLVSACSCAEGCPSCIGPAGENGVGGKPETLALLEMLK